MERSSHVRYYELENDSTVIIMEKQSFTISFARLSSSFRSMSSGSMNANTMWRLHISLMLAGLCAVVLFAYFTYMWAVNDDIVQVLASGGRDTQTISELESTIAVYQAKEKTYESLLTTRPDAPAYGRGFGVELPPNTQMTDEVIVDIPVETTATATPSVQMVN